ncbi:SDR family NAD(P)-dependent oxidoreductase [Sphingobacterium corticibacterium]|uniref:SDR family NAD(P)-dependent oxidoreductase n=1 Tax=Sphingobacterium corticibacterium TaxID=2484746 RepID=A0A4Q6XQH2_9SPHI|nr:SDR family NAD(P)-dependent oxidoreductase [Sphingobacterium corticibacterium]RZF58416.1 SDR family NAD(P)-dependent oxidoreductase [Sphingobacterium corticibacterium]
MILVTGGTGFLGSTLIKLLIDEGNAVLAIKREQSEIPELLRSSSLVEWFSADITDYFALADVFDGVTQVYHCAAKISYQKEDWASMLHTNIEGTKHIVNLCLEHGARLVHVSSIAALGTPKIGELISEQSKWDDGEDHSKYGRSKYESEMEVWRGVMEGLDAVIVNPSVIMGIGSGKKGSGAIFNLIQKGIKVYPPGTVGIVDVEDVAKIMILLMNNRTIQGERFVLNSENLSNKNLLERIAKLLGKPAPTIKAHPFMLSIAWRIAKMVAYVKGSRPALTRETAKASAAYLAYSNKKLIDATGYCFKPVDVTLEEMSIEFKTYK